MGNDLISVVIPTFNREKEIEKSIKSVLAQTYKNIEVIVIDDGSKDKTEQVVKKIKDERVSYYKLKKNKGACYARNYGIKKAKGKYIAFQDSDDIFHKNKLKIQLENLQKNKSDFDFCKICLRFQNKNFVPNSEQEIGFKNNKYLTELCNGNFISTQSILARKEIFKDIKFDDSLPRLQDYDLVLRVAAKYKISYTNKPLVDLYNSNNSIGNSEEKLKKSCQLLLRKKYDLNEEQEKQLFNTLIFWATKDKFDKINEKFFNLANEHNQLIEEYNKQCEVINSLESNNKTLINENKVLKEDYNRIINSKRWKMISKIAKLFKK